MAKKENVKVKIIGHAGNPVHTDSKRTKAGEQSGVQTSIGDFFHGETIELPEDEARLLVAAKRAKLVEEEDAPVAAEKK